VVHVIRHPEAVLASRKRAEQRTTGGFRSRRAVLRDLARSLDLAHRRHTDAPEGR
jgi:hypothetical protein